MLCSLNIEVFFTRFLVNIMDLIEKNVECEGIFRKSGSVSRLKDLRVFRYVLQLFICFELSLMIL